MYTNPTLTNANIESVIINSAITVKQFCRWTCDILCTSLTLKYVLKFLFILKFLFSKSQKPFIIISVR